MRHIKDEIRGRKIMKRWDIVIDRYYIDEFGKDYITHKGWDDFASKAVWERERSKEVAQMRNCGYKISS